MSKELLKMLDTMVDERLRLLRLALGITRDKKG